MIALLAWAAALAIPAATIEPRLFDDDEEQGLHFHADEETGGRAQREETPGVWLTRGDITREHLLEVQALIVKDERVTDDCRTSGADLRKSNWRHFMCYGSILSNTFILTSTSCLHEALYIRHNIQATLAAVIAPVSESIQVIKISQYIIHPKIDVDPRHTKDYIKYDLAVAKLSCKISKKNFFPIELPTKPLYEMCKSDNCFVTIIKRTKDHTNLIFEYMARDIEDHKLTLRQTSDTADIKKNDNINIKEATTNRLMCTKTGSAVMANKIQAGLVAMSCDVRQPEIPWLYTDLFDNVNWIVSVANLEMPKAFNNDKPENQSKNPSEKCSNCVYNFYFDWKEKDVCSNKVINDLGNSLFPCKNNSEELKPKKNSSDFIAALPKDDYLRALDTLYHDQYKHNHEGVPIPPPSDEVSMIDKMIPVTNNFEVINKTDTKNKDENQKMDTHKPKENEKQKSAEASIPKENENQKLAKSSKTKGVENQELTKSVEPKGNENQEFTKSSKPKGNENQELRKLSKSKDNQKAALKDNPDVPNEYKILYEQYLRELNLKKSQ